MAFGEVKGICKKCGQEFTVRKKFHKGKEAREFEQNCQDYFDECPECYGERRRAERAAEEEKKPIIITLKNSKIEEPFPITIFLTGETYPVKEKLKELGYKWDKDNRAWSKYLLLENVKREMLDLEKIKEIKMSGRLLNKGEYNNWLAAHKEDKMNGFQ